MPTFESWEEDLSDSKVETTKRCFRNIFGLYISSEIHTSIGATVNHACEKNTARNSTPKISAFLIDKKQNNTLL